MNTNRENKNTIYRWRFKSSATIADKQNLPLEIKKFYYNS